MQDLPTVAPKLRSLFGDAPYRMDHECARPRPPLSVPKLTSRFSLCLRSYFQVLNSERRGGLYLHGGGQGAGGPSDLVGPTDGGQCYYRYSNGRFFKCASLSS